MRRTLLLAGIFPFFSAFLGGVVAFGLVAPSMASAQAAAAPEVRASSFVLVGDDGTVQARLGIVPGVGIGSLTFLRADGQPAASFSPAGFTMFDPDGAVRIRVGRCVPSADFPTCPGGLPPFEGLQLGPNGSVSVLPSQ